MNDIIQAYFFKKDIFNNEDIIDYLLNNNLPITQKISEHKFYYKVKLLSEKKLKLEGYNIIQKPLTNDIKINIAMKPIIKNNFVSF